MAQQPARLPAELLKQVSRSFYLTLRALPGKIRFQIGLAYLLARTTDTVADTSLVPLERRLEVLQSLHERIAGLHETPINLTDLVEKQGSSAEKVLLERCERTLGLLRQLWSPDLNLVREVLRTITSGQELDLKRFEGASSQRIISLQSDAELDDYTYRVAGCVGEFWTRMCRAHIFPQAQVNENLLLANGVRFGKGLQLVNILRDLPVDLRNGRCYLPNAALSTLNLRAEDLLEKSNEARFRPLYNKYLDQAEGHLMAGWDYTNSLPRSAWRVRLACSWPILIGLKTLKLLRTGNVLDAEHRIKVTRHEVKKIMLKSFLLYPWAGRWERLASQN